jgi:hypothetical protein
VWGQVLCRERRTRGGKVSGIGSELGGFWRGGMQCVVIEGRGEKHRGNAMLGGDGVGENNFLNPPLRL